MRSSRCYHRGPALLIVMAALALAVVAPEGAHGANLAKMFGKKKKKAATADPAGARGHPAVAGEAAAAGGEFAGLKVSELMRRAREAGQGAGEIAEAMDSDDPKAAFISLLSDGKGATRPGSEESCAQDAEGQPPPPSPLPPPTPPPPPPKRAKKPSRATKRGGGGGGGGSGGGGGGSGGGGSGGDHIAAGGSGGGDPAAFKRCMQTATGIHGQKKYAEAVEAYTRCTSLSPAEQHGWHNLGVALQDGPSMARAISIVLLRGER